MRAEFCLERLIGRDSVSDICVRAYDMPPHFILEQAVKRLKISGFL